MKNSTVLEERQLFSRWWKKLTPTQRQAQIAQAEAEAEIREFKAARHQHQQAAASND